MKVVPSRVVDRPAVEAFLDGHNAVRVARHGELVDVLERPALLAIAEGQLVGVATYVVSRGECELLTLHVNSQFTGTGSALLTVLVVVARRAACSRLWVVTTNDNLDALRFYQRRGFRLTRLRPGAVSRSRQSLKPEIPATGLYGIEIRDEVELEMDLR